MANTALGFPFGFFTNDNLPQDAKYFNRVTKLPYANVEEATDLVLMPLAIRHKGLTINIAGVEYCWKNGIQNADLVEKNPALDPSTTDLDSFLNESGNPFVRVDDLIYGADNSLNINFRSNLIYNKFSLPGVGTITDDLTGAIIGVNQKIYHSGPTLPTLPSGWVNVYGTYRSGVNIFNAEWSEANRVEYKIFPADTMYYVRPTGTTYGTADGTSYANAWSGFPNINWSLVQNNSLSVCGTHLDRLIVGSSNVKIFGNNSHELGVIDGYLTLASNIIINNYKNVYFEGIVSLRANLDGIFINGTAVVITRNCTFSQSNNQGIQHYDTSIGIHYNVLCEDNHDDGCSAHHSSTFYLYGGNLNRNAEGINHINNTRGYAYAVSFSGNTSQDIRSISEDALNQCILEVYDTNIGILDISTNAKVIANNCTIAHAKVGAGIVRSYLDATNCDIELVSNSNLVDLTFTNCNINNIIKPASITTNVIRLYNSYCRIQGIFNYTGILIARRTLFSALGNTNSTIDMQGNSTTDIAYCIFKDTVTAKFAVSFRASAIITRFDNITIDNNGVGSGVFSLVAHTFNNLIIHRCVTGMQASGVVLIANNCCFNGNTTNTVSTVTQNNSQNAAPNFVNPSISDYRLDVNSSCINTGITAVETRGILSTNWTTSKPVVVEIDQSGAWDIGAYVK